MENNRVVQYCSSLGEACGIATYTEMLCSAQNLPSIKDLKELKHGVPSYLHLQHEFGIISLKELSKIIRYCRKNKVRLYVTMHSVYQLNNHDNLIKTTLLNIIGKIGKLMRRTDRLFGSGIYPFFKQFLQENNQDNNYEQNHMALWEPTIFHFLFVKKSQDLLIKYAQKLIVHSQEAKEELLKQGAQNIEVRAHPVKIFPTATELFSEKDKKLHIGYFGFFSNTKALSKVIDALMGLEDVVLHIYSSIPNKDFDLDYYHEIAKKIKEKERIKINTEFLPLEKIVSNLSKCDLNVWCSKPPACISVSGSIRQYLAAQRPIIASSNIMLSDINDIVQTFPLNNSRLLAEAARNYNPDTSKIRAYIQAHTWDKIKTKYA